MLFKRIIVPVFLALVFLIFAQSVSADENYSIRFFGEPKEMGLLIENPFDEKKALEIELFSPIEYDFPEGVPSYIKAGEELKLMVKFYPREELTGSVYESTLLIRIGGEEVEKSITMEFNKRFSCPVSFSFNYNTLQKNGEDVIELIVSLENTSLNETKLSFAGIEGLPEDWEVRPEKKLISLDGLEEREFIIIITPKSSFEEKATVNFFCSGFELKKDLRINYQPNGTLLPGLASLFGPSSLPSMNLFDVFLVFIAAVLLIAFISRLVKRLY